ncbi:MAG: zinc carboxypeptidase, partial [Saprospiraceae bacterium]|nr:zinc carboxypeptidase [Saprospiraceae bacterium]
AGASGVKAFDYRSGKESTVSINPNDLVISAFQPKSTLLEALFEPRPRLSDSLTYDITAWALPYAYGLDAYALKEKLEPKKTWQTYQAPEVRLAASPYAWCIRRSSIAEASFMGLVLQKGIKVRYATKPFAMADQQFEAGTYVIVRADNRTNSAELDSIVQAAAAQTNIPLHAIFSGYASKGNDFGSEAFTQVQQPKAAVVYGDDVDDNSFGHTWFFFERELAYPVTALPLEKLQRVKLSDYNTLIFPNGSYNLTDRQTTVLKDWVQAGGRIIAFDGGVKAFAGKDGFELKLKEEAKKDTTKAPKPYLAREREGLSDQLPGAIVKAKVDATNPLAYGLGEQYFSLKINADAYEISDKLATAVYLDDDYQSYGFIGNRVKPRLKNTPIAAMQRMGQGQVVYFLDNPLFRSFWQEGKVLFSNALFF